MQESENSYFADIITKHLRLDRQYIFHSSDVLDFIQMYFHWGKRSELYTPKIWRKNEHSFL